MDSLVELSSECSSTESITTHSPTLAAIVNKPRLKPVWQSPVWIFVIAEDIKYAKCRSCDELVARGRVSMKGFNTTHLVNHLKLNHLREFEKFQQIIMNKETQRKVANSERIQGKLNQMGGMLYITLQATKHRTSCWGINDPEHCVFT